MRVAALIVLAACSACQNEASKNSIPISRIDLPLEQRLDLPQRVAAARLSLADFVSFIATSFKVPLLVETPAPVPGLDSPEGTYTARQLLDVAIGQLSGFAWKDEAGVAHIYQKRLLNSPRNILNVRIPHFAFPHDVGEFIWLFRPCISSVIQGYRCEGGAYSGFQLPALKQGGVPYLQFFTNEVARNILLAALRENGIFYLLIAFEGTEPKLKSKFPFLNWFAESLEVGEPSPLWVQTPKTSNRSIHHRLKR